MAVVHNTPDSSVLFTSAVSVWAPLNKKKSGAYEPAKLLLILL